MHYLWFDCETGGLNAKIHTLLTAYFAVCDGDLNVIDEIYLQLKPEDESKILVEAGAMNINKINLNEHLKDPNTLTYAEGNKKLQEMLNKNKIKGKRKHYMPCGHNVGFDKDFIWEQLIEKEDFEKTVHYRTLDTSSITNFLKDVGIFPKELGNLMSLVNYFNIPMGEAHNARGDVLMNIEVYRAMRLLMNTKKNEFIGTTNTSLLKIVEV